MTNDRRQVNFLEAKCQKCNRRLGSEFRAVKLDRSVPCQNQRRNPGSISYHLFRCPHRFERRSRLFQPFLDTSIGRSREKMNIINGLLALVVISNEINLFVPRRIQTR